MKGELMSVKGKKVFSELQIGYCLFALCNMGFSLYLLYDTVTKLFPKAGYITFAVFVIFFIPITFILPYFDKLACVTAVLCGVMIENIDDMSYGERTLHLSFCIFEFITKAVGIIMAILTFLVILFFSFVLWLVSGSWFEDGIVESFYKLRTNYEITKWVAKLYNKITSITEMIFIKVIDWEKKWYGVFVRHRMIKSGNRDMEPVRQRSKDEDTAYKDYIDEAQGGNTKAQVVIGEYLLRYEKTEEGLQWLKKAYLQKEPTAYTAFGNLYMNGTVFQKNEEKAIKLYKLGIKGRDPSAMYLLAMYYLGKNQSDVSMSVIIKLLTVAANMEEELAAVQLGKLYFEGDRIKRNEEKAFYWLNKAVMIGREYTYAGYYLGRCYLEGIGVEKNEKKGFQVLKCTEEEGGSNINQVRELLITCYRNGIGVRRNTRKAKEYRIAKDKSDRLISDLAEMMQSKANYE